MRQRAAVARGCAHLTRRALVGLAWTLAWTLVWGSMLMVFASHVHAAPPTGSAAPAASR